MKPVSRFFACAALAAALLFSCTGAPPQTTASEVVPGWKWTPEQIDETVNQVRAGRSLQPDAWPDGARMAVLLSFDVDNETGALRYGEPTHQLPLARRVRCACGPSAGRGSDRPPRDPRLVFHPVGKPAAQPALWRR